VAVGPQPVIKGPLCSRNEKKREEGEKKNGKRKEEEEEGRARNKIRSTTCLGARQGSNRSGPAVRACILHFGTKFEFYRRNLPRPVDDDDDDERSAIAVSDWAPPGPGHPANDYRASRDYGYSGIPMISVGSLLFVIAPIMALFSAEAPQGMIAVYARGPPPPPPPRDRRSPRRTRIDALRR